jgi:hypothetical protein
MKRVVPHEETPDSLTQGEKQTWAAYLPVALVAELKRCSKVDGFTSTSGYVETLLVFALREREEERLRDRAARK